MVRTTLLTVVALTLTTCVLNSTYAQDGHRHSGQNYYGSQMASQWRQGDWKPVTHGTNGGWSYSQSYTYPTQGFQWSGDYRPTHSGSWTSGNSYVGETEYYYSENGGPWKRMDSPRTKQQQSHGMVTDPFKHRTGQWQPFGVMPSSCDKPSDVLNPFGPRPSIKPNEPSVNPFIGGTQPSGPKPRNPFGSGQQPEPKPQVRNPFQSGGNPFGG